MSASNKTPVSSATRLPCLLLQVRGDVIVGADGIWSSVRATMRGEPAKGEVRTPSVE